MAKTPGQRGEFGRWLERVRKSRYETQAKALVEMDRLAGLRIAPSEYAQWESGSRVPRHDNPKVARLYEFFGSRPEPEEEPQPTDLSALIREQIAATRENTAMLERLLAALLPNQPDPELVAEAVPEWAEAERRSEDRRSTRLPRTPDPVRPLDPAGAGRSEATSE